MPFEPALDVGGAVSGTDEEIEVRVDLTNRGAVATGAVTIGGELAGHDDEATVAAGVAPGQTASARLTFPRQLPRPGVHAVVLLLEYAARAAGGGSSPPLSQRAFLLLTLGADAAVPVRIAAPDVVLGDRALWPVTFESADGRAHRMRVRALGPRGLNPEHAADEIAVPATGAVTLPIPLLRGSVPRPSRQGLLLVAETIDGDVAQAATATAVAMVAPAPNALARVRVPLIVAGSLLLAAAAWLEWRHVRRGPRPPPDVAATADPV